MPAKATKSQNLEQTSTQLQTPPRKIGSLKVAMETCLIEMSEVLTITTLEEIMKARGWDGHLTPRFLSAIMRINPKQTQRSTGVESDPDNLVAGSLSRVSHYAR